jgi:hypothetical protein
MSYQQTRSTQDPSFYPKNFSSTLALTSVALPNASSVAVADPVAGLAPVWEKRVYSGTLVAGVPVTVSMPPAPNGERFIVQAHVACIGFSGTFTNQVWAQASMYWASMVGGVGTINQVPTAPLTAGFNEGAFSSPPLTPALSVGFTGTTPLFTSVVLGVAGSAKYTITLDVTRASF